MCGGWPSRTRTCGSTSGSSGAGACTRGRGAGGAFSYEDIPYTVELTDGLT